MLIIGMTGQVDFLSPQSTLSSDFVEAEVCSEVAVRGAGWETE